MFWMSEEPEHARHCAITPLRMAFFSMGEGTHRLCRTISWRNGFCFSRRLLEMARNCWNENHDINKNYWSSEVDSGSQFSSDEFATFMKRNGIKHFNSAPNHPATNALATPYIWESLLSKHRLHVIEIPI